MNLPTQLRSPRVRLAQLSAAAFAAVALLPAGSAASQAGAHSEERAARAQERTSREAEKAIRAQEREAARDARREAAAGTPAPTGAPGETGAGAPPSESGAPSEAAGASVGTSERGCRISVEASSTRVSAGEAVTVSGALECATSTRAADRQIPIYERDGGGASDSFDVARIVTTEADGAYAMTSGPLQQSTVFQVRDGRHRARVAVEVAPEVTIAAPSPAATASSTSGRAHAGKHPRVTFTGTVTPAVAGALVALQIAYAATGERLHSIAYGHVGADGSYSVAHTFRTAGEVSVRTIVHLGAHYAAAASEALSYEVPQPQNPQLSIRTSTDPLAAAPAPATIRAGVPLTLSGTLTPAASGQVVYLESESPNGVRFHVVAAGSVGDGTQYTITHTFEHAGTVVARVSVPGDSQHQPSSSAPFTITVTG